MPTLLIARVEAGEAAAAWRHAQEYRAQPQAASQAVVLLREAASLTGSRSPRTGPKPYRQGDAHRGPWPAAHHVRYRCTDPPASRAESA
ncbi:MULTISPECIES: hypothetical protein [unclassified Streptomyces]|uniref:hypothetical protein n=1 Tax=unclassified Streptomyces TaxID=2593676 RepID=UPI0028848705|nr:hypothetical protein [Streptomyces sp. DSM 41633]